MANDSPPWLPTERTAQLRPRNSAPPSEARLREFVDVCEIVLDKARSVGHDITVRVSQALEQKGV